MDKFYKIYFPVVAVIMITLLILYFDQERSGGLTPEEIAEIKSKYIYFYPENSPNAIAWSPRHILNWSHFKAEPNYNSNNSAFITWDIKSKPYCNTDNLVSVNSTAYMFQDQSWIKIDIF